MFSQAAASYYYQHRYAAYKDCINPCDSMTIVSISKYNVLNKYSTVQFFKKYFIPFFQSLNKSNKFFLVLFSV